jgi:predicted phage-related endonuclease
MATVTFDTLKFVETLKEAGVLETQAKDFSTAVRESHEAADVATKGDISDLRHEIKELETNLRHEIKELELRMTIKLGSTVVIALGAFTVIFKFL